MYVKRCIILASEFVRAAIFTTVSCVEAGKKKTANRNLNVRTYDPVIVRTDAVVLTGSFNHLLTLSRRHAIP